MSQIPIALQLYSVREDCAEDLPALLAAVVRMGYAGVEFYGYHEPNFLGHTAAELRAMLDDTGLKVCGTHMRLTALEGDELKRSIEFHHDIGNPYLIVSSLPRETILSREAMLKITESFNHVAEQLAPEGMRTGYHNHHIEFQPVDGEPPLDLQSEADVSRVAEFFASMSQRLDDQRSVRENDASWLSTMLGGLSDAVLVFSNEGRVLSLNERAAELLGLGRDEIQGKLFAEFFPEEHPVAEIVKTALERDEPVGPVDKTIANGKRPVVYALSAQVLRDESGVSGVMVSARDMEKLSRLGSQLSYAQKLAALGKLTSGVAHEIKNPLNAMVIHVALLRERLRRASPETQSSLDTLEKEIRRLDRVIQGFLRFTRPEDLQLTSVPLRELLDEVERLVSAEAKASGIEIETAVAEELPPVHGDRELLQQVFLNLVQNAEEAMPRGGRLRVEASRTEDGVEIVVADSGVGIEPEMLEKIFDLYVTTKKKGSGIGLSMVYRIVQLHGGEITVESEKGNGTRFTIHLPEMRA